MIYCIECFEPIGQVQAVSMFGGYALKMDGYTFGLVFEDEIYLKADAESQADYEAIGSTPFRYEKQGKMVTISNWKIPMEILEDSDELRPWVEKAFTVARKKAKKKKK